MNRASKRTRLIVISFFLFLSTVSIHADRILYTYDASGNRTYSQKEVLFRGDGQIQEQDTMPRRHDLGLRRITIYPNPTEGRLRVEITGDGELDGASIAIYGATGSIVYYDNEVEAVNNIDITPCTNGIYLLIIRVDGETSSWKLVKI